ncbi:aminotransferase [Polycladidibacter stylochi]|uniref:aminotransferase n=1 Tax=Polycladidibacter stylochi TaxID=1807766 RepID=UPI000831E12B|nr:aminotransferase [Pseudovibrio stylochi]
MKPMNPVFAEAKTTIFEQITRLAIAHDAINLGQGFPEEDGPYELREIASKAILKASNQYPPMLGIKELRSAVSEHMSRFYDLNFDPDCEVLVTSGATEALADTLLALIEPGDEVILIEPLYDCYLPLVFRAGGIPKRVRLSPPNWQLSENDLAAAFSENTKAVLLNNPMNPSAKVFTKQELELIAKLAIENDCYVICDEVYEHIVFEDKKHIPLISLKGMADRTVKIGSAGKTFSMTGWKIGYVVAEKNILSTISKAHQFVTFTSPPALQHAVAAGLSLPDKFYHSLSEDMQCKRDLLASGLQKLGFIVDVCEGSYFLNCDIEQLLPHVIEKNAARSEQSSQDLQFIMAMITQAGVAAVPLSAFYISNAPQTHIRFCFCKSEETLNAALERLRQWLTSHTQWAHAVHSQ